MPAATEMATRPLPPARQPRLRETGYVSVQEFADHWGCSERTVWRDIEKGAIKVRRVGPGGRIVRILRTVMETYGRPN